MFICGNIEHQIIAFIGWRFPKKARKYTLVVVWSVEEDESGVEI
jgi:hypothetical protein